MEPRLSCTVQEAIADFVDLGERYAALSRKCTREQLLWRPASGAWCIAECVEHVARANVAYLTKILPALSGARTAPAQDGTLRIGGWLSALLLKSVSPEAPRKLKSPGKIRPLSVEPDKAFSDLKDTHAGLRSLLEKKPRPDYNRVRFQNPFVPLVRFTVASGILIMAAHGRRHLLQAERVSLMPGISAEDNSKINRSA